MAIFSLHPYVLKNGEILSLLRIIELPLIVLAFSTELAYKATLSYSNSCPTVNGELITVPGQLSWSFPYDLKNFTIPTNLCNANFTNATTLISVSSYGQSIAFLVISVVGLIHCLFALITYLCCWIRYRNNDNPNPKCSLANVDFIISLILALAWLGGSIAWLVSVIQLDYATRYDPLHNLVLKLYPCLIQQSYCDLNYSSAVEVIYASPIAGLIVALLYFAHLYFVWKNTTWYLKAEQPTQTTNENAYENFRRNLGPGPALQPQPPAFERPSSDNWDEWSVKKEKIVAVQTNPSSTEYRRPAPPRPPPPYNRINSGTVIYAHYDRHYEEPPVEHVTRSKEAKLPNYV